MKKTKQTKLDEILNSWNWPYLRTNFSGSKEYKCPHGIGHGGIHGCDFCCSHKSFLKAVQNEKSKKS